VIVAQNTTVSDTYRGIGDSIGRYSGILIPGIGGIDRKTGRMRVACASQLYNYILRFYLIMPPPLKRVVPNPLYA
jgi:hypothetical protein